MDKTKEYVTNLCNSYDYQKILQAQDVKEIFHYTTTDTLCRIIENKKLRFSNRLYMNDSSEGRYVLDLCIRRIDDIWNADCEYDKDEFVKSLESLTEKLQVRFFQFYQASFSLSEDNLTMWNYYSKGDGINIKFTKEQLIDSFKSQLRDEVVKPIALLHGAVVYDEEKQIEILKKVLKDFSTMKQRECEWYIFAPMAILNIGTFFKHCGFRDEREYRIAYNLYSSFEDPNRCISLYQNEEEPYRFDVYCKENMLIPYVDVSFDNKTIREITLSPKLTMGYYADGLRLLLEKNGFDIKGIKIKKSSIPLRF